MVRDLRLAENKGTIIHRKDGIGDVLVIRGSCMKSAMYPEAGFLVSDINYVMPFPIILPFRLISEYEVLESDDQEDVEDDTHEYESDEVFDGW